MVLLVAVTYVIHAGVGAIREYDVQLAAASDGIIIGFNVRPERTAAALAEQEKVDVRLHTIIYDLTNEIRKAMAGLLEPVIREVYLGRAEVRDTFRITKVGTVAGCWSSTAPSPATAKSASCAITSSSTANRFAPPLQGDVSEVERHGMRYCLLLDSSRGDVIEPSSRARSQRGLRLSPRPPCRLSASSPWNCGSTSRIPSRKSATSCSR
jgi:translation initiation factor IF-2